MTIATEPVAPGRQRRVEAPRRRRHRFALSPRWSTAGVLIVAVLLAACGGSNTASSPASAAATLHVVATTTVFADIVRNVDGDRVAVSSIVPAGAGPEDYEPKPEDARKLAGADLIVSNGAGLDDFLDKLVNAAGEGAVPRLVLAPDSERLRGKLTCSNGSWCFSLRRWRRADRSRDLALPAGSATAGRGSMQTSKRS